MNTLLLGAVVLAGGAWGERPPSARDDAPIKAVVAHFAKQGIHLQQDPGGWWVVTDPKADGYEVIVYFLAFPATATEQQMRDDLQPRNLAFILNAPARVAMSYPGLRHTDPTKKPPPLEQIPAAVKLKSLFQAYRPPAPAK